MKPEPGVEAARWLKQAEIDLMAARDLQGHGRFHLVCFIAQQTAEKAMKAFLYGKGEELVLGHSVGELSVRAAKYDPNFSALGKRAAILDRYYVAARYPNGVAPGAIPADLFNKEDGDNAVNIAAEVIATVKNKLGRLPGMD